MIDKTGTIPYWLKYGYDPDPVLFNPHLIRAEDRQVSDNPQTPEKPGEDVRANVVREKR